MTNSVLKKPKMKGVQEVRDDSNGARNKVSELEELPPANKALRHDFANRFAGRIGYSENPDDADTISDAIWKPDSSVKEEIDNTFHEFMEGVEEKDCRKRAKSYKKIRDIRDSDVPDTIEQILDETLDFFRATESYRNLRSEKMADLVHKYVQTGSNDHEINQALEEAEDFFEEDHGYEAIQEMICEDTDSLKTNVEQVNLDYLLGSFESDFDYDSDIEVDNYDNVPIDVSPAALFCFTTIRKNWDIHGRRDENGRLNEDSYMWVEVDVYDDEVEISIYDDGPGLDDDQGREELTEYSQEDDSRTGLALTENILENFEGELEIYEPETSGMGQRITVPRAN